MRFNHDADIIPEAVGVTHARWNEMVEAYKETEQTGEFDSVSKTIEYIMNKLSVKTDEEILMVGIVVGQARGRFLDKVKLMQALSGQSREGTSQGKQKLHA